MNKMDWHLRYKLETGNDRPSCDEEDVDRLEKYIEWLEEKAEQHFERLKQTTRPVIEGDYVLISRKLPPKVQNDTWKKLHQLGIVKSVNKMGVFVEYYSIEENKIVERPFNIDNIHRCEIKLI